MREIIACLFLLIGVVFITASAIGVLRLPDFYSRLHASGMGETLGLLSAFIGLAIINGINLTTVKLIIIALFIFLANPIGTHMLVRAGYKDHFKDWRKEETKDADTHH